MIVLILTIIVGMALLTGVLYWATRSLAWKSHRQPEAALAEAEIVIKLSGVNFPSQDLVDRIFSEEDYRFIAESCPPELLPEFLKDRKRISLLWLQQVRMNVRILMDFYRKVARLNPELVPAAEVKIVLQYLSFQFTGWFLAVMIRLQGPFGVRRTSRRITESVEAVSLEVGRVLALLDDETLARLHSPGGP